MKRYLILSSKDNKYSSFYHVVNHKTEVKIKIPKLPVDQWSDGCRGEALAIAVSDGNGLNIFLQGEEKVRLDYGQAAALYLLLHELHKDQKVTEFKVK